MALEQQLAEAIALAFDQLGGEPSDAVRNALYQRTVGDWMRQETTKSAFIGGAEMAIPGLHLLTIPAGISYLLHKMASISWGIGALRRATIIETAHYSDLRNILSIWANNGYYDASQLSHRALHLSAWQYALSAQGYNALVQIKPKHEDEGDQRTRAIALHLAYNFPSDERAQALFKLQAGAKALDSALAPEAQAERSEPPFTETGEASRRIGAKLALRLGVQLSARVPARLLVGLIPVVGVLVNAFANAGTLQSMADSADKYYANALRAEEWQTA
jgi:hypothetical protein